MASAPPYAISHLEGATCLGTVESFYFVNMADGKIVVTAASNTSCGRGSTTVFSNAASAPQVLSDKDFWFTDTTGNIRVTSFREDRCTGRVWRIIAPNTPKRLVMIR